MTGLEKRYIIKSAGRQCLERKEAAEKPARFWRCARRGKKGGHKMLTAERWGMIEIPLKGPAEGNPFTDYTVKGVFKGSQETIEATGFYDGDGLYKVRFMPSFEG